MKRVLVISPYDEYNLKRVATLGELLKAAQDRDFVIQFDSDDYVDCQTAMQFAYEIGDVLLIIDEAHFYGESEILQKIMRVSRKTNTSLILISHSFFDFVRRQRAIVKNILVFRNNEPYELVYIERICPDATQDKVKALNPGEYLIIQGVKPEWLSVS